MYNKLKNEVLENVSVRTNELRNISIKMLTGFINNFCSIDQSVLNNLSIKNMTDLLNKSNTPQQLQININDFKKIMDISLDCVFSTVEDYNEDYKLYFETIEEYDFWIDEEIEKHLKGFKKLNDNFMYVI